jgi:hypothetical protein
LNIEDNEWNATKEYTREPQKDSPSTIGRAMGEAFLYVYVLWLVSKFLKYYVRKFSSNLPVAIKILNPIIVVFKLIDKISAERQQKNFGVTAGCISCVPLVQFQIFFKNFVQANVHIVFSMKCSQPLCNQPSKRYEMEDRMQALRSTSKPIQKHAFSLLQAAATVLNGGGASKRPKLSEKRQSELDKSMYV